MRNVNISGVFVIRLCCDVVSLLRQRESTQLLQPLAVHDNRKSGQEVFGNREEEEEDRQTPLLLSVPQCAWTGLHVEGVGHV